MKKIAITLALSLSSQLALAHGVHALVANHAKTIETAYEQALHKANYDETEFDNLVGVTSIQDASRKVRVIKYKFVDCAKDLEIYMKLDGSAYYSNKVVGCAL